MIMDCIADLHGFYPKLEGGDLLIVAGDLTAGDTEEEHNRFQSWIDHQNYRKKIVIAGNHDNFLEKRVYSCLCDWMKPIKYLCDSRTEFEGLKIWGSPWTKTFKGMNPHCKAFTVDTDEELAEKWAMIPDDTDILITHSPAWGIHDLVFDRDLITDQLVSNRVGSGSLITWIANHINTLKLHVCGHIHEGYGIHDLRELAAMKHEPETTIFVNASYVNERYQPVNRPVRIILPAPTK